MNRLFSGKVLLLGMGVFESFPREARAPAHGHGRPIATDSEGHFPTRSDSAGRRTDSIVGGVSPLAGASSQFSAWFFAAISQLLLSPACCVWAFTYQRLFYLCPCTAPVWYALEGFVSSFVFVHAALNEWFSV